MILSDVDLLAYIRSGRIVVHPFDEEIVRENGLDLRIGDEVCELRESYNPYHALDPFDENAETLLSELYQCRKIDASTGKVLLQPRRRYLLSTLEYIKLPSDLMAFVELRSTFARLGFIMPPTIIDAGFEGQITIEVMSPPFPVYLKRGARFLHVVFAKVTSPVQKPYSGRYQGQRGVTLPKLPP